MSILPLITTIGTMTLLSGSTSASVSLATPSNEISSSDFGRFGSIAIYSPSTWAGAAFLQGCPQTNVVTPLWSNVQSPISTSPLTLISGSAVVLTDFPFDALRVSSSLSQSSDITFTLVGQVKTILSGQAALID